MPEGDTLARISAVLRPLLVGQTIIAAHGRPGGAVYEPYSGAQLRIPAKEIVYSDLISIIYRAQRSRQSYGEPLIDISQEK